MTSNLLVLISRRNCGAAGPPPRQAVRLVPEFAAETAASTTDIRGGFSFREHQSKHLEIRGDNFHRLRRGRTGTESR